jgi:hypothetical protein
MLNHNRLQKEPLQRKNPIQKILGHSDDYDGRKKLALAQVNLDTTRKHASPVYNWNIYLHEHMGLHM